MNIKFEQPELWTPASCERVLLAAQIVGAALSPYTGLGAEESFNAVFGTVRTWFVPDLKTYAEANWGNIKWRNSKVITLPLAIHEMGHLFGVHAKNKPTKQLWLDRNKIDTIAASPWPGQHPPSLKKYNIVEQFCNAWEVWVLELDTDYGDLHSWMDAHMGEWVAAAMGVKA